MAARPASLSGSIFSSSNSILAHDQERDVPGAWGHPPLLPLVTESVGRPRGA